VSAGLAAGAVGTDTRGSIRIPSALCGIVGLKPTFGRVSRDGVHPLARSFDTVGPMTRTVEDAALFLEVMAGPDPSDPQCSGEPVSRYTEKMRSVPAGVRVGRLSGPYFEADLDPAVARGIDDAARVLTASSLEVQPLELPGADAWQHAQGTILMAEAAAFHHSSYPGREDQYGADVRTLLERGEATAEVDLQEARTVMTLARAEMTRLLIDYPVLLGPAMSIGAFRIADADPRSPQWSSNRRVLGRFMGMFSLVGLPAIALPVGLTSEGLPVAIELVSGPFTEGLLLGVARRLEQAFGWSAPELPQARPPG